MVPLEHSMYTFTQLLSVVSADGNVQLVKVAVSPTMLTMGLLSVMGLPVDVVNVTVFSASVPLVTEITGTAIVCVASKMKVTSLTVREVAAEEMRAGADEMAVTLTVAVGFALSV